MTSITNNTNILPPAASLVSISLAPPSVDTNVFEFVNNLNKRFSGPTFGNTDYMQYVPDLTPELRYQMIDWIIKTHALLKLQPETLYKTIQLLDWHFASMRRDFDKEKHILTAACLLIISSKKTQCRELEIPLMIKHIPDCKYSMGDFFEIYEDMSTFESGTTSYEYLMRYLKISYADKRTAQLACYALESTLLSYELTGDYSHQLLAAASLYLARTVTYGDGFNSHLMNYNGFDSDQLKVVAKLIKNRLENDKREVSAFINKYISHPTELECDSGWVEQFYIDEFEDVLN
jgi:hypothetical protein